MLLRKNAVPLSIAPPPQTTEEVIPNEYRCPIPNGDWDDRWFLVAGSDVGSFPIILGVVDPAALLHPASSFLESHSIIESHSIRRPGNGEARRGTTVLLDDVSVEEGGNVVEDRGSSRPSVSRAADLDHGKIGEIGPSSVGVEQQRVGRGASEGPRATSHRGFVRRVVKSEEWPRMLNSTISAEQQNNQTYSRETGEQREQAERGSRQKIELSEQVDSGNYKGTVGNYKRGLR